MTTLRIATRTSQLAQVQARWVAARIESVLGVKTELLAMKTSGDRLPDVSLATLGGKGLFVKEIEEALLRGEADVAVHSTKDLPAVLPAGLVLAAFPERADPRDALLSHVRELRLDTLPARARIGTGSLRRAVQLQARRDDLRIVPLRGNVPTRLQRLERGDVDALVLACAGLDRLGLGDRIDERLPEETLLPAVGQGVLAIEARGDAPWLEELEALTHAPTAAAVACERAFLARLGGDCNTPVAAYATQEEDGALALRALLASPAGDRVVRAEARAPGAADTGVRVADEILERGGREILAALRAEANA